MPCAGRVIRATLLPRLMTARCAYLTSSRYVIMLTTGPKDPHVLGAHVVRHVRGLPSAKHDARERWL